MGEKTPSFPLLPILVLFVVLGLLLVGLLAGQPKIPPAAPPTAVAVVPTVVTAEPAPPTAAVETTYTSEEITQGQSLFQTSCSACHGTDASGIAGLGKNLRTSAFVHGLTDEELHNFIVVGRPITDPLNTTGIMMPPKGGNPSLSDEQINLIVAYIRKQGEPAAEATPAPTLSPEDYEPYTLPIEGMDFLNYTVPEQPFDVAKAYALSCSGCHGAQGEGGSGGALVGANLNADDVFALLTETHPPIDPYTGFSHPVRGEYPALNDDQLRELVDYVLALPG